MGKKGMFYKGQIIRRKSNGSPIGPYMRVIRTEHSRVYAEVIGHNEPIVMLLKDNVYPYKQGNLLISEELLERLKKGSAICAQHVVNIPWQRIYEDPPELIRFYTQPKNYEAVFVLENVQKMLSLGDIVIRVIVDNKIV